MIRASNLYRLSVCPGSHKLEAKVSGQISNTVQAAEGRLLHGYSQNPKLDRSFLKPNQRDLLKIAEDCRSEIYQKVFKSLNLDVTITPDWKGGNEMLLWENEIPGHCDFWHYSKQAEAVVIIDEKYGWNVVEPATANLQLRGYAVGAIAKWDNVSNVFVAIVQPRLPYEQRITMAVYYWEDLVQAERELKEIKVLALTDDAPLVAGEEQCRYCTAKLICPAFQKVFQQEIVLADGSGTVAKRQSTAEALIKGCTNEELQKILQAISFSDFIKEQARDEARTRLKLDPDSLSGYLLGRESSVRRIADTKRAVSLLTLRGEISQDDALECCEISIGAVEEKLRNKTNCTWKEAKDRIESTLSPVLEFQQKKQSLTRKK
jgi:hypothetical protein